MEGNIKDAMERSGFLKVIEIGIPCKFTPLAIIPKFIWDYVEDEVVCVCRGGDKVMLEKIEEYNDNLAALDMACMDLFHINFKTYDELWGKRVLGKLDGKWVKVKMHKIEG